MRMVDQHQCGGAARDSDPDTTVYCIEGHIASRLIRFLPVLNPPPVGNVDFTTWQVIHQGHGTVSLRGDPFALQLSSDWSVFLRRSSVYIRLCLTSRFSYFCLTMNSLVMHGVTSRKNLLYLLYQCETVRESQTGCPSLAST